MNRRLELHGIFIDVLETRGQKDSRVYFQPPESVKLKYPCIIYDRNNLSTVHADNNPYSQKVEYKVTIVDSNPDSDLFSKVAKLPLTRYDRSYVAGNLFHDVLTTYY